MIDDLDWEYSVYNVGLPTQRPVTCLVCTLRLPFRRKRMEKKDHHSSFLVGI